MEAMWPIATTVDSICPDLPGEGPGGWPHASRQLPLLGACSAACPGKGLPLGASVYSLKHSLMLTGEPGGSDEVAMGQSQRSLVLTHAPENINAHFSP